MTVTPDEPWPHCGQGSDPATSPEGCPGIRIPGRDACLAHVTDAERSAYFTALGPGSDIDHRGTPFTEALLGELLGTLRDSGTSKVRIGNAQFEAATFEGTAEFGDVEFSGEARFEHVRFHGSARFGGVRFSGYAGFIGAHFEGGGWFASAQFEDAAHFEMAQFGEFTAFLAARFGQDAGFNGTRFGGDGIFRATHFGREAQFGSAQFDGEAQFDEVEVVGEAAFVATEFARRARFTAARFDGGARFDRARFAADALFDGAQFINRAWFHGSRVATYASFTGAQFTGVSELGPLVCGDAIYLSSAMFTVPFTLRVAARRLACARTQWEQTATLHVRYAAVDLTDAVLNAPLAVIAHPTPFEPGDSPLAELAPAVAVTSVRGLDAAHLVLTDVDLSDCVFSGAFHLDQLRLEGHCAFAPTPTGLHRRLLWPHWWTRRRTLAEEHHWRAQSSGQQDATPSTRRWRSRLLPDPRFSPAPEDIAALYRQLRKGFEDSKNDPGAADFYYGEMEMRRHNHTGTPRGERGLLWAYWLLSGYGLRASRALGWLGLAMMATVVLMMGFGLPQSSPKQQATGVVPAGGGPVTFEIDNEDPKNPTGDRYTSERFEKALKVTLNSVVFRSSGPDLTTAGDYIEMTSRFTEPVLLALAALAVRGRVKRGN
ncbi:pentapeptide repeat-containing protein [Streptomyces sp. NPDC054940]